MLAIIMWKRFQGELIIHSEIKVMRNQAIHAFSNQMHSPFFPLLAEEQSERKRGGGSERERERVRERKE